MSKYDRMTDEQLLCDYKNGNQEIMDYLMVKYKSMVRKKARAMYLLGGENEDLIQEGMIGLIKAVRDFDVTQKTSFSSFAELCVSRQMYSAIEASNRKKHLPLNSYVSLYEDSEQVGEGRSLPLIDTIGTSKENDPESSLFWKRIYRSFCGAAQRIAQSIRKSCSLSALDGNGLSDDCGITWKESEVSGQCTSEDQDKSTKDSAVKEKYG